MRCGASIYGRDPEDGAFRVPIVDAVGNLEGGLSLANASKALNGSPLAVIVVDARRGFLKKLLQNGITSNEVLIASEWDEVDTVLCSWG